MSGGARTKSNEPSAQTSASAVAQARSGPRRGPGFATRIPDRSQRRLQPKKVSETSFRRSEL